MAPVNITAIIPAAGKPTNKLVTHSSLPDTMLPINGKPVIGYILDDLLARNIKRAIVILNKNDEHTEKYITKKFGTRVHLTIVRNPADERGVGYSLYLASEHATDAEAILVYLGDTIYKGQLEFENDFLVTTPTYESSDKWCFVETAPNGKQVYINKPKEYNGSGQVLTGLYFLRDSARFKNAIATATETKEKIEIHDVLEQYDQPFTLVTANQCYDCGNIENYYKAKIDFLRTRSFNTVMYNDLYGTITKTGQKKEKLEDEINWYKNTPEELKVFSPRLIDYRVTDTSIQYSLEYYGYQSLADYFVFNHFDEKVWRLVIDRLFEILALYKKYTSHLPYAFYDDMYRIKTLARLESLRTNAYWDSILKREELVINDVVYRGWPHYSEKLGVLSQKLYEQSPMTFIHGDPCLSNILFDPHNRIFKLIDPRGSFGTPSVYGDHHYDVAKLRHSFVSRYDFIVSDLFGLEEHNGAFNYQTFHDQDHENVGNFFDLALSEHGYDPEIIRCIEALLFLSMIPLHSDAPQRQRAMFLTGITLLNSLNL